MYYKGYDLEPTNPLYRIVSLLGYIDQRKLDLKNLQNYADKTGSHIRYQRYGAKLEAYIEIERKLREIIDNELGVLR